LQKLRFLDNLLLAGFNVMRPAMLQTVRSRPQTIAGLLQFNVGEINNPEVLGPLDVPYVLAQMRSLLFGVFVLNQHHLGQGCKFWV